MTNNQICDVLGIAGCLVIFFGMGFMFFGCSSAIIAAIMGVAMSVLALANYE